MATDPKLLARFASLAGDAEKTDELPRILDELHSIDADRLVLVADVVHGLQRPVLECVARDSDVVVDEFAFEMRKHLVLHHLAQRRSLDKAGFEEVCELSLTGRHVEKPTSRTNRFWDLAVGEGADREQWSLKTEAASKMNDGYLDISKLSEAQWITNEPTRWVQCLKEHMQDYSNAVSRVLVLRCFAAGDVMTYQLVEFSPELLTRVDQLPTTAFPRKANGKRQLTERVLLDEPVTTDLRVEDDTARRFLELPSEHERAKWSGFTVTLDKSQNKVTIKGLPLAHCIVHATWVLPQWV